MTLTNLRMSSKLKTWTLGTTNGVHSMLVMPAVPQVPDALPHSETTACVGNSRWGSIPGWILSGWVTSGEPRASLCHPIIKGDHCYPAPMALLDF